MEPGPLATTAAQTGQQSVDDEWPVWADGPSIRDKRPQGPHADRPKVVTGG